MDKRKYSHMNLLKVLQQEDPLDFKKYLSLYFLKGFSLEYNNRTRHNHENGNIC